MNKKAEEYITKIKLETGVSDKFLNEARPKIELLFNTVSSPLLEKTLKDITSIIKSQAEMEENMEKLETELVKLNNTEKEFNESLKTLHKETKRLHNTVEDNKLIKMALLKKTIIKA